MVDRAITRDPVVKFLLEKLDEVSTLPFVPLRLQQLHVHLCTLYQPLDRLHGHVRCSVPIDCAMMWDP